MVEYSDVLIAYKEYPHTDVLDRALELVDICSARVEGRYNPVPALVDCNVIINGIHTSRDPGRAFVDRIKELENSDPVILSVSLIHGFPWGDVPGMGTKVLVYTDNDPTLAAQTATQLANEVIELRDTLGSKAPGIDAALDISLDETVSGPIVLADTADNTGGGAAGDSTFVLRQIIERGVKNAVLGPLWDPGAVRIAFEAGEGARIALRIGGKVGPGSGDPVDLTVTVVALRENLQMGGVTAGTFSEMGDAAYIDADGVSIVLVSRRNQATNIDLFTQFGCDLLSKRLIVVKSSQHFYASFSRIAAEVVYADSPGALASDLTQLPYRKIKRPKWPFDDVVPHGS
jgi:microcystin degradation protein MlrC